MARRHRLRRLSLLLVASTSMLLAACQEELYRDLPENQANIMAAKLLRAGIAVDKTRQKDNLITLSVSGKNFADSVEILAASGYPQSRYTDSAELFKEQGMISSPTEEWARVVYARSQEIAQTISEFDGVILARVHIAVPKKISIIEKLQSPSASVFIKYRAGHDLSGEVPSIKQLVARSIEGLSYRDVSVVMSPGFEMQDGPPEYVQVAGLVLHPKSVAPLKTLALIFIALLGLPFGFLFWRYRKELGLNRRAAEGQA